ncbi:hypothetical protein [Sphingopyxis sp.]|nr:hypothetical protein [Sphingopyxis sp.]
MSRQTAIVRHPQFDAGRVDRLVFEGLKFAKRVKAAAVRAN